MATFWKEIRAIEIVVLLLIIVGIGLFTGHMIYSMFAMSGIALYLVVFSMLEPVAKATYRGFNKVKSWTAEYI